MFFIYGIVLLNLWLTFSMNSMLLLVPTKVSLLRGCVNNSKMARSASSTLENSSSNSSTRINAGCFSGSSKSRFSRSLTGSLPYVVLALLYS